MKLSTFEIPAGPIKNPQSKLIRQIKNAVGQKKKQFDSKGGNIQQDSLIFVKRNENLWSQQKWSCN